MANSRQVPRQSPDFLASVLDALGGIVYVYDLEENHNVFISSRWAEDFGYTLEETNREPALLARIIHPDDMPQVRQYHHALRHAPTDDSMRLEYRVIRKDGSFVWVSSSDRPLTRGADGLVKQIVGHAYDISAQKVAESRRAEGEHRFQAIVQNLPDAVFIAGPSANILEVNDAACEQLGYTREELLQMRISDLVPPDYQERVRERLSAPRGSATGRQSVHVRKDGTRVPVETVVVAAELEGEPVYLGVARDISDRLKLENQLRDAQRMESIGRLAGAIAHDFNNILAAILGGASLLEETVATDSDRAIAAEVVGAANRGARLVEQLLTFSKRRPMTVAPLDLSESVRAILKVIRRLFAPTVQIETQLAEEAFVLADSAMLDQVVMNLAINARDAMRGEGTLTIEVGSDSSSPESVILTVSDTGRGIDAADLPKVFEPFFTTKAADEGSGIGLATAYGIVTQHGGQITVDSEKGKGTTFRVSLPRASKPPATRQPPEPRFASSPKQLCVLLVEDQASVRSMIKRGLERSGHSVLCASNASEAESLWKQQGAEVDLLLTDFALGSGANGHELLAKLRTDKADLPAVVMSGFSPELASQSKHQFAFIQKPFRIHELNELLSEVLSQAN